MERGGSFQFGHPFYPAMWPLELPGGERTAREFSDGFETAFPMEGMVITGR